MRWLLLLGALSVGLTACGGGDDDAFVACGGDLTGGGARVWNFNRVALSGAACGADAASLTGFVSFNGSGRYSVNAKATGWSLPGQSDCGFNTTYGGFYKAEGSKVCFAETEADLAAFPCDESGFDAVARPRSAGADYCVTGPALELSTRSFIGLTGVLGAAAE